MPATPRSSSLTGTAILGATLLALGLSACSPSERPSPQSFQQQHPAMPTAAPVPGQDHGNQPQDPVQRDRKQITQLDGQITQLIQQRNQVSADVQNRRTSHGGAKTDPAREKAVTQHYRSELGEPGARIAAAILDLSRGPQQ